MVFVFAPDSTQSVFQKRASLCDRTLLTAFVFAFAFLALFFRVPAFTSKSLSAAGTATIYASSSALMKHNTHSS
jgi:hypothetical protein